MGTFHDIVEAEARHDYDPEPDYDTPTAEDRPARSRGPEDEAGYELLDAICMTPGQDRCF